MRLSDLLCFGRRSRDPRVGDPKSSKGKFTRRGKKAAAAAPAAEAPSAPGAPQGSRFLALPGEIRNKIFSYYLASHGQERVPVFDKHAQASAAPPSLAQVSQQLRHEVLPLWAERVIFVLPAANPNYFPVCRRWIECFAHSVLPHTRRFEINGERTMVFREARDRNGDLVIADWDIPPDVEVISLMSPSRLLWQTPQLDLWLQSIRMPYVEQEGKTFSARGLADFINAFVRDWNNFYGTTPPTPAVQRSASL